LGREISDELTITLYAVLEWRKQDGGSDKRRHHSHCLSAVVENQMTQLADNYQAYMLRIWKERSQHPGAGEYVRLSLEDTQTGARIGFADLERLCGYLQRQISAAGGDAPGE
jgi:hypothetical protein